MLNNNEEPKPRARERITKEAKELKKQIATQMLTLATSGFGLVAALAWNEFIQTAVKEVINPLLGQSSGLISQLIYAVIVTALAVIITYNLSKFAKKED